MRDEDVAAAFAAAQENPDNQALARRAIQQRLALQREMGVEEPRLLSDAEREEAAEQLAQATPADRPALIAELRRRYGDGYESLVKEVSGRVAPDTGILLTHADDPVLTGTLARGMAMDGVEFNGARELGLPMIGDKLDSSRLEDKQLYQFMVGERVVSVVYDRKVDALVPALVERGGQNNDSGLPGRVGSAINGAAQHFVGQFARIPEGMAISEGAVYQGVLNVFNQIEAGEKPDISNISGWAKGTDLFRRYLTGDRAERDALYAEVEGIARGVIGSDLYGAGQWLKATTRQALPTNPEFEDEFQQRLARGGGSFAAFVVTGAAGRAVRIPAALSTAALGAFSSASVMFQDAIINGDTWDDAYRKAQLGVIPGLSEALPIARLFGRVDKGAGGSIRKALIEAAKGGTEEALQETFEAVVSNLIKSGAVDFHEEGQLFQGVGENADVAFTLGALANFFAAAAGIRRRPAGPMDALQLPTAPQRHGLGAELAPEDTGNASSADTRSGAGAVQTARDGSGAGRAVSAAAVVKQNIRDLVGFVQQIRTGRVSRAKPERVWFGRVSDARAQKLQNQLKQNFGLDFDLRGAVHRIDEDAVAHILRKHGSDQVPFTAVDFELIPDVVETGNLVSTTKRSGRRNLPVITYRKLIGDWYYVVEEVQKKGRILSVQTAYKTPAPKKQP